MNPFSRFLSQTINNRRFLQFVHQWDVVEQLVIQTFRGQGNLAADALTWREVRALLRKEYPVWEAKLRPLWKQAVLGGTPAPYDPFEFLLNVEDVQAFQENWQAMQTLPAAREAINRCLLDLQIKKR